MFYIFIIDILLKYENEKIEVRTYADDVACIWDSIDQAKKAINIMKEWWETSKMKVNYIKSGLLRILKRRGKNSLISNSLNILEINCNKYIGVIINQSLLIEIKRN